MRAFVDLLDDVSPFSLAHLVDQAAAPGSLDAAGPDVDLHLAGAGEPALKVVAFDGVEAVNAPYTFEVVFLAPAGAEDFLDNALGQRVHLRLGRGPGGRDIHGLVLEIALLSAGAAGALYRLKLGPKLSALAFTRQSKVFQNKSAAEVLAEVLRERGVEHRLALSGKPLVRAYCVQYEESDLDFISRLVAEEGWVTFFDHGREGSPGSSAGTETLVIADSTHAFSPLGGRSFVVRPPSSGLASGDEGISRFSATRRMAADEASLRDFDFQRAARRAGVPIPNATPELGASHAAGISSATARVEQPRSVGALSVIEHHGQYADVEVGRREVETYLGQLRARAAESAGTSNVRAFLPGSTIQVSHPETEHGSGTFVITRVLHRGRSVDSREGQYENQFRAVEATTLPRPERAARRVIQAVESAVVVGPVGQEVGADSWGSVRVQFHWDQRGTNDEHSSCHLRVAQSWSGPGYGFQFVPRIGAEVLVAFLGGDPDKPVIVASLPNAANPLPHPLPTSATQSGIRTRSSPNGGGGHNELFFEDQTGGELVRIRAERNYEEIALGDHSANVGGNVTQANGGARQVRIGGADTLTVGGGQLAQIGGDAARVVGGSASEVVAGDLSVTVGKEQVVRIGKSALLTVGSSLAIVAGEKGPGQIQIQATDLFRATAKNEVRLQSGAAIDFVCGTTRISLRPDRLEITAEQVTISSPNVQIGGEESQLAIAETVSLTSDSIVAEGKSARLSLESEATLQGDKVHLTGPKKRKKPDSAASEGKTNEAVFRFVPPDGLSGPFTLRFSTPDGEIIERDTDANDEVRLEGRDGDKFVLLSVRAGTTILHHAGADDDADAAV